MVRLLLYYNQYSCHSCMVRYADQRDIEFASLNYPNLSFMLRIGALCPSRLHCVLLRELEELWHSWKSCILWSSDHSHPCPKPKCVSRHQNLLLYHSSSCHEPDFQYFRQAGDQWARYELQQCIRRRRKLLVPTWYLHAYRLFLLLFYDGRLLGGNSPKEIRRAKASMLLLHIMLS